MKCVWGGSGSRGQVDFSRNFTIDQFLFMVVYLVYVPHRRKQIESLMNFLEDNEHIALLDVKGMNTRRSLLFSNWIPAE
jgi:hypothetical protein